MWRAILAGKEDNIYYLLKAFADSLDDDIIKKDSRRTVDSTVYLIELMNLNKEKLSAAIKEKTKTLQAEFDKISSENKKILADINASEEKKQKQIKVKGLEQLRERLISLRNEKKKLEEDDENSNTPKSKKQKNELNKKIKETQAEIEKISRENQAELQSFMDAQEKNRKKQYAPIIENKEKLKKIKLEIDKIKTQTNIEEKEKILEKYMKSPSLENLQEYLDSLRDLESLLEDKSVEFEESEVDTPSRIKASKEIKEQVDASLSGIGWNPEDKKTISPTLKKIREGKLVSTKSQKFSNFDLAETILGNKFINSFKSLLRENKNLLQQFTIKNRELSYPSNQSPEDYFSYVLDNIAVRSAKAGKTDLKTGGIGLVQGNHIAALKRIFETLKNISDDGSLNESKRKRAILLQKDIIAAIENKKIEVGDIKWASPESTKRNIRVPLKASTLISEEIPKLVKSTIELYDLIASDISLSNKQEAELENGDENSEAYKEMESMVNKFLTELKGNKNLQESVVFILSAFSNVDGEDSPEQYTNMVNRYLFDDKYKSKYMTKKNMEMLSEEDKNKIADAANALRQEMENNIGEISYGAKINQMLEDSNLTSKRVVSRKMRSKTLANIFENPKDTKSAVEYLRKFFLPVIKKIDEKLDDGKIKETSEFYNALDDYLTGILARRREMKTVELRNTVEALKDPNKTNSQKDVKLTNEMKLIGDEQLNNWLKSNLAEMEKRDKKTARKFTRIFENKRTQDALSQLGIKSVVSEQYAFDPNYKPRKGAITDENKLSISEETILQALKRKNKEKYDKYIGFTPKKLKATLQQISDKIKEDVKNLSEEDKEKYNQLDTDLERKEFIIGKEVARGKKK